VTTVSTVVLASLALVAVAGAVVRRVRRQRRRWVEQARVARGRVGPRHPIILLHGLLGFDELEIGSARHEYFRGIADRLGEMGARVHRPPVARTASVATRARQLVQRTDELGVRRVNIIAHSMGGLDARYAIAHLGLADRVASLTTIATPHRGTPLADLGAGVSERLGLRRMVAAAGLDVGALFDLTTPQTSVFNARVPDRADVWYGSVLAFARRPQLHPVLWPTYQYLRARAGRNDGLVPVSSQHWGEVLAEIEADHWAQIGWSRHFDAAAFFEHILCELRARGF